MVYLELVLYLLLKTTRTNLFNLTRLQNLSIHQTVLSGCLGEHWFQDKLSCTETCENSSPLKLNVCQKPTFLITSSTLQNHHFDSFALSKIRLSPPLPLFLAIQHPHGSFNKVTLYYFPKSLPLDKVRCLSRSALSLPDISLMYNIGRRKVLDLGSRHSLWLMPLIHSTWLMIALPSINTCHHLWEFKNPHRGSKHSSVY